MNTRSDFASAWCVARGAWSFFTTHNARRTMYLLVILIFGFLPRTYALDPNTQIEGFNLEGFGDDGEKAWEVNGTQADIQGTLIKLSNIIAHSYGKDHVQLTAKTGSVDQGQQLIHLKDNVVIRKDDGSRLTTDSLNWDRKADVITTQDDVTMINDQMIVTGTGMESHPKLKQTTIQEDVKVQLENSAPATQQGTSEFPVTEKTIITSDGPMTVDQTKNVAVFEDNVMVIQEGGRTLKSDRLEVEFSAQTKKVEHMVATGRVEIVKGLDKTYADKAVYDAATQKLLLYGRPKLILNTEGDDVITPVGN